MTRIFRNSLLVVFSCLLMLCIGLGATMGIFNTSKANAETTLSFNGFGTGWNHTLDGEGKRYETVIKLSGNIVETGFVANQDNDLYLALKDKIMINDVPLSSSAFAVKIGTWGNKERIQLVYLASGMPQFSASVTQIKLELKEHTQYNDVIISAFTLYLNAENKWQPGVYTYTPAAPTTTFVGIGSQNNETWIGDKSSIALYLNFDEAFTTGKYIYKGAVEPGNDSAYAGIKYITPDEQVHNIYIQI